MQEEKIKRNRLFEFFIVLLAFIITLLIFYFFTKTDYDDFDRYEYATLNNQYVGYLEGCCDNCLVLNVTGEVCHYMKCGHIDYCKEENRLLYFENEFILLNKSEGDSLKITWKYIPEIKDYRIRGVQ